MTILVMFTMITTKEMNPLMMATFMFVLIANGMMAGIMEYWVFEKESQHLILGHLPIMPFEMGDGGLQSVDAVYEATNPVTKKKETVEETWETGRVGRVSRWQWSKGGGTKGFYACKILPRLVLDTSSNPIIAVEVESDEAGYWLGDTYFIPMDFSLSYIDRLKSEVQRRIRNDPRFREDSRIYVAEHPLAHFFRKPDSVSDMETKVHDRTEALSKMTRAHKRLYHDMEEIRKTQYTKVIKEVEVRK